MITMQGRISCIQEQQFADDVDLQDTRNKKVRGLRAELEMPAEPQVVTKKSVFFAADNDAGPHRGDGFVCGTDPLVLGQMEGFEEGDEVEITIRKK